MAAINAKISSITSTAPTVHILPTRSWNGPFPVNDGYQQKGTSGKMTPVKDNLQAFSQLHSASPLKHPDVDQDKPLPPLPSDPAHSHTLPVSLSETSVTTKTLSSRIWRRAKWFTFFGVTKRERKNPIEHVFRSTVHQGVQVCLPEPAFRPGQEGKANRDLKIGLPSKFQIKSPMAESPSTPLTIKSFINRSAPSDYFSFVSEPIADRGTANKGINSSTTDTKFGVQSGEVGKPHSSNQLPPVSSPYSQSSPTASTSVETVGTYASKYSVKSRPPPVPSGSPSDSSVTTVQQMPRIQRKSSASSLPTPLGTSRDTSSESNKPRFAFQKFPSYHGFSTAVHRRTAARSDSGNSSVSPLRQEVRRQSDVKPSQLDSPTKERDNSLEAEDFVTQLLRRLREDAALSSPIPDHYVGSPLCPMSLKHKSGGTGVCPMHGRRPLEHSLSSEPPEQGTLTDQISTGTAAPGEATASASRPAEYFAVGVLTGHTITLSTDGPTTPDMQSWNHTVKTPVSLKESYVSSKLPNDTVQTGNPAVTPPYSDHELMDSETLEAYELRVGEHLAGDPSCPISQGWVCVYHGTGEPVRRLSEKGKVKTEKRVPWPLWS